MTTNKTTKKDRLRDVFEYLRYNGYVRTQKDLANKMNTSAPNISNAMRGLDSFLTDGFFYRLNATFDNIFNEDWLLYGKGEMLAQPQSTTIMASNNSYGDNAHSVILKPIVNKLLASRPNTDVYKIVKGDGVKLQHILAFPQYDDFDFYYQVRQDAMFPTYDKGDILALMHMPVDAHIIQGSAMVIDTKSFGFLFRRVYDNGDSYECKCINENSVFRNQSIPKDDVIRLYRVIYSIKSGD